MSASWDVSPPARPALGSSPRGYRGSFSARCWRQKSSLVDGGVTALELHESATTQSRVAPSGQMTVTGTPRSRA
jgi:hypothetical protein